MVTNRLLPQQFAAGLDISGTRIEQGLAKLVEVYNDVPADLVKRRWCPSHVVAGYSPSNAAFPRSLPWMGDFNDGSFFSTLETPNTLTNPRRVKSYDVPQTRDGFRLIWEIAFANSRPVILSALSMFAEWQATGPYVNDWTYGAIPPTIPPGLMPGDPTTDFTFGLGVDDAWDIDNRRKLKQEVLLWRMRSDAFFSDPLSNGAANDMQPVHPIGTWQAQALCPTPLVLLPAYSRARVQMVLPTYIAANRSSWPYQTEWNGNVWTMHAEILEPTR